MPVYEFYNPEIGTVEVVRPVERRDEPIVLKRKTVPARVLIAGGTPAPTQNDVVRNGYYAMEQQQDSRFRSGQGSKAELKKKLDKIAAMDRAGL